MDKDKQIDFYLDLFARQMIDMSIQHVASKKRRYKWKAKDYALTSKIAYRAKREILRGLSVQENKM